MATPFLPAGATTGDSGGELSSGDDSGDVESPQNPETEASRNLAELFEKAAAHLQSLIQVASREQLLYLYARYKQVKVGNCNTPKPGFFDFEGKQKWEAWKALGDLSPSQAMQEYVAVVKTLDPGWNPQIPEKKGKEANSGFGGPVVSSLYHEETIREEDKNIFDYCRENNIDHITKAIKLKNMDVNTKDEEGRALLHWACDRGHKELVTVLLQCKADINCQEPGTAVSPEGLLGRERARLKPCLLRGRHWRKFHPNEARDWVSDGVKPHSMGRHPLPELPSPADRR
ncbi:acyl-CoA-binding domain-containing protein 6 isoform X3 [Marmota marmota marmota]|uniref:acyl-CoA-binding domain-containing protein 6 isoform X1 n=1 Tax=Marmota flaviventris TaxID=93162 RepID=UPI000FFF7AD6|nr:acyl-CoA-binding domain-containing protein 6 isoform X1 [Marmota flaviventris]XP_048665860.1 acyl-CoA-binding domain-containing protein 6 isoform X3 [Marmota marmota marmota]